MSEGDRAKIFGDFQAELRKFSAECDEHHGLRLQDFAVPAFFVGWGLHPEQGTTQRQRSDPFQTTSDFGFSIPNS